jgi:hypothetical protein
MNHLEPAHTQLLELLRQSDGPSDADRTRVRAAIAVALVPGATVATSALAGHNVLGLSKFAGIPGIAKVLTAVGLLGVVGAGLSWHFMSEPPSDTTLVVQGPSRLVASPIEQAKASSELSPPAGISVETLPKQADEQAPSRGRPSATAGSSGDLDAELRIIAAAQKSLKAGNAEEALSHLGEHEQRFPHGILSLERAGVRTIALCQAGRTNEGRAAAKSYLRQAPNSVLEKRIRVACQLTDE